MDGRELLVGRYELRGMLGCGGMAEVREAWDTRLNRAVAIKLLHPALRVQPDIRRRFEAEASAAASLIHPNIVSVYDCGEHDGTPFIVMERLPGDTVADQLANGPLPSAWVRTVLCDVLSALAVAHGAGVLHRDIKPGNILLSAAGDSMKVADFGIAKTGGATHTVTGQIVGTLAYMSPERVAGAPASVADDLYAVGVMAYEALVGGPAFPHDNPASLARAIVDDPPPPLSTLDGGIDPTLASVIDRAMAREPQHRFANAEQMRAAIADDGYFAIAGSPPPTEASWFTTRMTERPYPVSSPTVEVPPVTAYVPQRQRSSGPRRTALLTAAGALAALSVTAVALSFSTPSATQPAEPVGTMSVVPVPASVAPFPPAPIPLPPSPPPSVSPPSPIAAVPVVDQPPSPVKIEQGNGKGKGNGNGSPGRKNGHGGKKS